MKVIVTAFAAALMLGLSTPAMAVEGARANGGVAVVQSDVVKAADEISARKGKRNWKRHGWHGRKWKGHGWKRHHGWKRGWHGKRHWHGYRHWGGRRVWRHRYWGPRCWRVWYRGHRVLVCR
jgi:hypothetical protein